MAAITAPHNPISATDFANEIRTELKYTQGVTPKEATVDDVYIAAATAVRKHLVDSWETTKQDMVNGNTKAVGYLSA